MKNNRESIQKIKYIHEEIKKVDFLIEVFNAIGNIAFVINGARQIVLSNLKAFESLGIIEEEGFIGFRPGEVLECIYSEENKLGCGEGKSCNYCGFNNSIREAQKTKSKNVRETIVMTKKDGFIKPMDFLVTTTPIIILEKQFYIISVENISDKKMMEAFESIFFHDILNKAGNLNGIIDYLNSSREEKEIKELLPLLHYSSEQLLDLIFTQRDIVLAEKKKLQTNLKDLSVNEMIDKVAKSYQNAVGYKKYSIETDLLDKDIIIKTDKTLLNRILENLLKNALEASSKNNYVRIGSKVDEIGLFFYVYNKEFMSERVKSQIFKRFFSTKGENRGLGTYSAKLLTEECLHGLISFESTEENGTTFYVRV